MHVLSKPHNHTMFLKVMSDSSSGYMGLQQSAVKLLNLLTVYCIAAAKRTPTNHVLTACVVPSVSLRTTDYGMGSRAAVLNGWSRQRYTCARSSWTRPSAPWPPAPPPAPPASPPPCCSASASESDDGWRPSMAHMHRLVRADGARPWRMLGHIHGAHRHRRRGPRTGLQQSHHALTRAPCLLSPSQSILMRQ